MKARLVLFCTICWYNAASAQDLPPQILADQYLLEATKALERGDAQEAIRAFRKIEDLKTEPPPAFPYFYGKLLVENGTTPDALLKGQKLLKAYVMRIRRGSEHYTATLELLSKANRSLEKIKEKESEAIIDHTLRIQKALESGDLQIMIQETRALLALDTPVLATLEREVMTKQREALTRMLERLETRRDTNAK